MRLIDADALKEVMIRTLERIKRNPKMDGQERHIIAAIAALSEMINDAPTVDAVPVVRCKDCKFYHRMTAETGICELGCPHFGYDGFCSEGEKDGEHDRR